MDHIGISFPHLHKNEQADDKGSQDAATTDNADQRFAELFPQQSIDQESDQGQQRYQVSQRKNVLHINASVGSKSLHPRNGYCGTSSQ